MIAHHCYQAMKSTSVSTQKGATSMKRVILASALLTLTLVLPAQAQNGTLTRSFVSSAGVDSNPCTITQPCGTFAHAYTKISANGIITALDPGKYGPLTIVGPVTVDGNGWSAITAPATGNGVTINAVSGNVILNGLEIDGAGAAYNGVVFNSGTSLTVTNCSLQNFVSNGGMLTTGNGILMQPTSGTLYFTITNTTATDNDTDGILYLLPSSSSPNATMTIDHVIANTNGSGIGINTNAGSGGRTNVTVSNTITNGNVHGTGVFIQGGTSSATALASASIDNLTASGNMFGVTAAAFGAVFLGRSVITNNSSAGVTNSTSVNTFYSFQNNVIISNGTDGFSSLNTTESLH
jgi:hypothetical protein